MLAEVIVSFGGVPSVSNVTVASNGRPTRSVPTIRPTCAPSGIGDEALAPKPKQASVIRGVPRAISTPSRYSITELAFTPPTVTNGEQIGSRWGFTSRPSVELSHGL